MGRCLQSEACRIYYSPAVPWFKTWQIATGMDPNKKEMSEDDKRAMPRLMGGALVATFLFSYGLQIVVHSVGATGFRSGALVGVVVMAAKKKDLQFALPFGSFLAPAAYAALVWGDRLISAYLGLYPKS